MKRYIFLALLCAAAAMAVVPARADGVSAVAGAGGVTPPGCADGAHKMSIVQETDGGPLWVSARPASIGVSCPAIVYGPPAVFVGPWNPDTGGCIPGYNYPGSALCMGSVPTRVVPVTTSLSLCFPTDPVTCWGGNATVVRA